MVILVRCRRGRDDRHSWRVGDVRAADGQQSVSVTTGQPARKLWRIMTVDPAIDGH
jgi:hypothetical protein